jgi:hypothetical protein
MALKEMAAARVFSGESVLLHRTAIRAPSWVNFSFPAAG